MSAAMAAPSPGRAIMAQLKAKLDQRAPTVRDSLPSRTWRELSPAVRTTLVMLASDAPGDPRAIALQPWESLTSADREAIGSCARMMQTELRSAAALW